MRASPVHNPLYIYSESKKKPIDHVFRLKIPRLFLIKRRTSEERGKNVFSYSLCVEYKRIDKRLGEGEGEVGICASIYLTF